MSRWIRLFMITSLLALVAPSGSTTHATSGTVTKRCFAETGACIEGRFRSYWEENGGLAVFGFPLFPPRTEVNRDTGAVYLTQWFERNRFEYHPENAAPYDVLLGRVGDDRLLQQNVKWQDTPAATGPQAGCLWFATTRHTVCNQATGIGFKTYWENHGLINPALSDYERSVALFGLPLTQPRIETNANGDRVLTQWFERARFEYHPDNPSAFTVLLGLLGKEVRANETQPIHCGTIAEAGSKVNFSFDPAFCVTWVDQWSDEIEYRVVVAYTRSGEEFTYYEIAPNTTEWFIPSYDAPKPDDCGRSSFSISVFAKRPNADVLVGGLALQTECR